MTRPRLRSLSETHGVSLATMALVAAAAVIVLAGCETRDCAAGHYETRWISTYNPDTKTTTMQPQTLWVCDRYEPEETP